MSTQVSPLSLERYELKYLIPKELIEPISRYVEAYCYMDYYSEISPDHFYVINSLYLDTPALYILQFKERANAFNFNMRIRSYGSDPKPPYFFETKYKIREFVRKKRAKVSENWIEILENDMIPEGLDESSKANLEDFLRQKITYNVGPVILTQYRRKAYISHVDDYARVTFDRDLRYQEKNEWCVVPDEKALCHYDHPDSFEEPGCNVILELKCEKKIPVWMVEMIRHFQLVGGNFSKFGNSMATHLNIPDVLSPGSLYR
ncbi:polyphosphate polymerase domain-containing protein [Bdellovibrio sp. 22V]|uniref:polyphosphate polymerase domain-containing protein n=1 Tax=Bdellovibrio TaxID=958 RepID=UPI002542F685|nr:polyphosphate polymerase domain-containing protein [Bdellovibrio sp. 22V]WII73170.1 polyphosphate polymerase domain-containing protein [Bdellovibrio sp. 22V]